MAQPKPPGNLTPHQRSALRETTAIEATRRVRRQLGKHGMLLLTDRRRLSLVSIVAGGPITGSWWGHRAGHLIYSVAQRLDDAPGVLSLKLLDGKVTYIDRRLAPAILAMGSSKDTWQLAGLSPRTLRFLSYIERAGQARLDRIEVEGGADARSVRLDVRALADRLLVHTASIHTERGAHATIVESWGHLARRLKLRGRPPRPSVARELVEQAARELDPGAPYPYGLPWGRTPRPPRPDTKSS